MYGFPYLRRETPEERIDTRPQVNLLHRTIAQFIQPESEAKTVFKCSLDQRTALQHHERSMRCAFVQAHALAYLGQAEWCVALAQGFENRNGALQAMQLIGSVGFGNRFGKRHCKRCVHWSCHGNVLHR